MRLCCFFNYAPLYRQSIYERIDEAFDTQFYFGREVFEGKKSGIPKIDYSLFKKQPIEFKNKTFLKRFLWRTKNAFLALKQYDTFLITGDFVYSYVPFLLLCGLLRKRVYGWGHGFKTRKGKGHILQDFLIKNLTGFFTYSEGGKRRMIEIGYPADKLEVIYNSLGCRNENPTELTSNIISGHFGNNFPVIIFVGRLTPQKKLDWVLKALKRLKDNDFMCNLVVVGNGPCMRQLQELSEEFAISDNTWFYGECYDDGVNSKLIYNADLCISPGNVGLTAMNSMRFGTPVMSHNDFDSQMPEYEAILNGETGCLFKKGDFNDFCSKIINWLRKYSDKREIVRQNCYAMINGKWNSDNQIDILKRVITNNAQ